LIPHKLLKSFSDALQRAPWLWRLAISIYGFRKFNPEKVRYRKKPLNLPLFKNSSKEYDLVFDAQCLQTLTRQRGIGTYSLNFIDAMCRARPEQNFAAFLTPLASQNELESAVAALRSLSCPNLDILILDIFDSKSSIGVSEAQLNLTKNLKNTHCKSVITLSPFEKLTTVLPIPKDINMLRIGVLYDLIPLQFPHGLLISRKQRSSYRWSLDQIAECDQLLAISEESKSAWRKNIGPQPKIDVIYGGGRRDSQSGHKSFEERQGILCVAAEQPHKNVERLVAAYCLLAPEIQKEHELNIVGIRSEGARRRLQNLSSKAYGVINFPGYLDNSSLNSLYEKSRLLVMPSLSEGLSLPILEAWSHGLVAIGSANTVAQELIIDSDFLFDPLSLDSMCKKMADLLTDGSRWQFALELSTIRAQEFTWPVTAARALKAFEEFSRG